MSLTFLYVEGTNGPVNINELKEIYAKEEAMREQIREAFDIEKWEQKISEKIESVKMGRYTLKYVPTQCVVHM